MSAIDQLEKIVITNAQLREALDDLEQYARGFSVSGVYLADEIEGSRLLAKACDAIDCSSADWLRKHDAEVLRGAANKLREWACVGGALAVDQLAAELEAGK